MPKKTLLVGLDAACWDYYQPLLDAGQLPALAGLIAGGVRGKLHSTMPAWTPAAWATLITGKNPGKHGIFDMMQRRPGSYEFSPIDASKRLGTPFWTRLNQAGVRAGLVNLPFTHPPDPLDGFVVTGFGAPAGVPDVTYPEELLDQIESRFGPYQPWLRFDKFRRSGNQERITADIQHQSRQVDITLDLIDEHPVDLLAINLMLPDHANHWLPTMQEVAECICETDRQLGRLLQAFPAENVMVISDHGSRRVKGDFLFHVWLRDHGYTLQRPRTRAGRRQVLNVLVKNTLRRRWGKRRWEKLLRPLLREVLIRLPDGVMARFWRSLEKHMPYARAYFELDGELDYPRSKVFLGSSRSGLLHLNLAGREPHGAIAVDQRQAVLDELVEQLRALRDPEAERPLFSAVYTAEQIYYGAALQSAPDITIDFYDSPWNLLSTFKRGAMFETVRDRYFVGNTGEFGHHSKQGLYVFHGPDFQSGQGPDFQLADVPATLLHLYEVPIPQDYDGGVMLETLSAGPRGRPVRSQPGDEQQTASSGQTYSEEAESELRERLIALGYLD